MSSKYETVVGLEVHTELKTKSKIFCGCTTEFGGDQNTHVCPVCLGLPGAMPVLNKQVVEFAIKVGLALNCEILKFNKFDRKDDNGNLRELHLEKSIDVLNIGEPANSRPVTVKADDLRSTLLVSNDFFAVYKWEITGKVDFEKTADYSLFSVLAGQGKLTVDGKEYPIQKGSHFHHGLV